MTPSDDQLITWLRYHSSKDRVIQNALNLSRSVSVCSVPRQGWSVRIVSRRGVEYNLMVVMHPVTGEPERWYRTGE